MVKPGCSSEVEAAFRQAIFVHRNYTEAHCHFGNVLYTLSRLPMAKEAHRPYKGRRRLPQFVSDRQKDCDTAKR